MSINLVDFSGYIIMSSCVTSLYDNSGLCTFDKPRYVDQHGRIIYTSQSHAQTRAQELLRTEYVHVYHLPEFLTEHQWSLITSLPYTNSYPKAYAQILNSKNFKTDYSELIDADYQTGFNVIRDKYRAVWYEAFADALVPTPVVVKKIVLEDLEENLPYRTTEEQIRGIELT